MNNRPVVVVGGGLAGSSAAWQLARRGVPVLLLEQFEPGHGRGASHGSSRIFRHAYPNLRYVELARRALIGWRELEESDGSPLLTLTGAVDHGDPAQLRVLADALTSQRLPHQLLDPIEAQQRWPGCRRLDRRSGDRCRRRQPAVLARALSPDACCSLHPRRRSGLSRR